MQVSPTEIEDVLLAHPEKLVVDACVAGVSGGRTSDERNPRAWVVLSAAGRAQGALRGTCSTVCGAACMATTGQPWGSHGAVTVPITHGVFRQLFWRQQQFN